MIIGLIAQGLLLFCGVLGLIHGLAFHSRKAGLTRAARTFTCVVLLPLLLYGLISMQGSADTSGGLFPQLLRIFSPMIIIVGIAIVVLEGSLLVEHFVARSDRQSLAGNIYLGKVRNVLPGMEAAFVDFGESKNGVLYAGDVQSPDGKRNQRIETFMNAA